MKHYIEQHEKFSRALLWMAVIAIVILVILINWIFEFCFYLSLLLFMAIMFVIINLVGIISNYIICKTQSKLK